RKSSYILIFCLLVFLLIGCWDDLPIEERGFVVGSAIDVENEKLNGNYQVTLTNQSISHIGFGTASEQGGSDQKAYMNIASSGDSIFEIDDKMAARTSKVPFFEHLKVLVISKELAKTPHLLAD